MIYDVRPEDVDLFKVINDLYENNSLQWTHPLQISLELEKKISYLREPVKGFVKWKSL